MSENHQKSSWGGKRRGAGRPKNPRSQRALAAQWDVTVSGIKTSRFILCVAPELEAAMVAGQLNQRQARAIASTKLLSAYPRLLDGVEQGRIPRRYAERTALALMAAEMVTALEEC